MKKTFGQIVREKRKMLSLSQAELGEKIGVSVQTVSRWECDGGMPDISQIVPLAKVLGTTTDILLGMENSEDEAVETVLTEVRNIWNNAKINNSVVGTRNCDYRKAVYEKLREIVRKYPTNLRLLEAYTNNGVSYLKNIVVHHFFEVPEKEIRGVGERLGVDYVLAVNVVINDGVCYMTAKLINLETGEIDKTVNLNRKYTGQEVLTALANNVAYRILNKQSK